MNGHGMRHEFVRAMPDTLKPDTLYVSIDYVTTSHLCACGCGAEVVLPLHPTKWRLTFDGASVSMDPSVGSRTLPCRSHYWIDKGQVRWANRMSDEAFQRALERDQRADRAWHGRDAPRPAHDGQVPARPSEPAPTIMPATPVGTTTDRAGPFARALAALRRFVGS